MQTVGENKFPPELKLNETKANSQWSTSSYDFFYCYFIHRT